MNQPLQNLIIFAKPTSSRQKLLDDAQALGASFYPKMRKGLSFIVSEKPILKNKHQIPVISFRFLEKGLESPKSFATGFLRQADPVLQAFHATKREMMPPTIPGFTMSLPLAFFPAIYKDLKTDKKPYYFEGAYDFQPGDTFYDVPILAGQTWGESLQKINLGVGIQSTTGSGQPDSLLTCYLMRPNAERSGILSEPPFQTTQAALLRFAKTAMPADLQGGGDAK